MSGDTQTRLMAHAPPELTCGSLRRIGEGVGKVVYASEHWVVKRERSPSEILALIAVWKLIRRIEHLLPRGMGKRLLERPSHQIRLLRVLLQGFVVTIPRSIWFSTHLGRIWHVYRSRDERGQALADKHLTGTSLIPAKVEFPPTRVKVGGWPGYMTVCAATERVEATLFHRLEDLSRAKRFDEVEHWLDRFLELRQAGWRLGVFSVDAHLKNFGVSGDRIVLLDSGGLTTDWAEVEDRLSFEEVVTEPHIQLGLGMVLAPRPDLAARFNGKWKSIVNVGAVSRQWAKHAVNAQSKVRAVSA